MEGTTAAAATTTTITIATSVHYLLRVGDVLVPVDNDVRVGVAPPQGSELRARQVQRHVSHLRNVIDSGRESGRGGRERREREGMGTRKRGEGGGEGGVLLCWLP